MVKQCGNRAGYRVSETVYVAHGRQAENDLPNSSRPVALALPSLRRCLARPRRSSRSSAPALRPLPAEPMLPTRSPKHFVTSEVSPFGWLSGKPTILGGGVPKKKTHPFFEVSPFGWFRGKPKGNPPFFFGGGGPLKKTRPSVVNQSAKFHKQGHGC